MVFSNNLLLTEHEGRTGEYWPKGVATEGQYSLGPGCSKAG